MADPVNPYEKYIDPRVAAARAETDPLGFSDDIGEYKRALTREGAKIAEDFFRDVRGRVRLRSGELSEKDKASLRARYTEMLTKLDEYEMKMRMEKEKSGRADRNASMVLKGQLLKYISDEHSNMATVISAQVKAAEERLTVLDREHIQRGLLTSGDIEDSWAARLRYHGEAYKAAGPNGFDPSSASTFYNGITEDLQQMASDPRQIMPYLQALEGVTGDNNIRIKISDYADSLGANNTQSKAIHDMIGLGIRAEKEADTIDQEIDAKTKKVMDEFNKGIPDPLKYLHQLLGDSILQSHGLDSDSLLNGGTSGQTYSGTTTVGPDGKPTPESKTTKDGSKVNPYTKEARDQIFHQLSRLDGPQTKESRQIRDAIYASDGFAKFKKDTGVQDDFEALQLLIKANRTAEDKSARSGKVAADKAILSGKVDTGAWDKMGARLRSSVRDMFGGQSTEVPATGAQPSETVPSTSAAVTAGAGLTSTTPEQGADSAKAIAPAGMSARTDDYTDYTDSTNPAWQYRQYADGHIELIGSPDDRTISPDNRKPVTNNKAKAAIEEEIASIKVRRSVLAKGEAEREAEQAEKAEIDEGEVGPVMTTAGEKPEANDRKLGKTTAQQRDMGAAMASIAANDVSISDNMSKRRKPVVSISEAREVARGRTEAESGELAPGVKAISGERKSTITKEREPIKKSDIEPIAIYGEIDKGVIAPPVVMPETEEERRKRAALRAALAPEEAQPSR